MKNFFGDIGVNDTIYVDGDSSFCTGGYEEVTEIKTKYDEDTGEPYRVICTKDQKFDGRSGLAITPPLAYYITIEE